MFCSFPSAKTCPFFCRAKRAFPSGKTLILPISRDSRYNTLHFASKVVCQRVPLWKPYFVGVCSHTSSKMQNKRHRPARSRCCSIPLICLHGLLILSPILTVLFYHFCMYRRLGNSKPSGCLAHGSVVVDNVIRNSNGPFFNIFLHGISPWERFYHHITSCGILCIGEIAKSRRLSYTCSMEIKSIQKYLL